MKKIISTIIFFLMFVCIFTACSKQETKTESATADVAEIVVYYGERPLTEFQEIPTYSDYLSSQANACISDFSGTGNFYGADDSRRFFFKTEVVGVVAEYESSGGIYEEVLDVEKIEDGLYRVNPTLRICYYTSDGDKLTPHNYVTFKIKTADGGTYYMTWVPPKA